MAKGILEFNLPEESQEFDVASKAYQFVFIIQELDQYLRSINKYDAEPETYKTEEAREAVQSVRDKLWEIVKEHDVGEHL